MIEAKEFVKRCSREKLQCTMYLCPSGWSFEFDVLTQYWNQQFLRWSTEISPVLCPFQGTCEICGWWPNLLTRLLQFTKKKGQWQYPKLYHEPEDQVSRGPRNFGTVIWELLHFAWIPLSRFEKWQASENPQWSSQYHFGHKPDGINDGDWQPKLHQRNPHAPYIMDAEEMADDSCWCKERKGKLS